MMASTGPSVAPNQCGVHVLELDGFAGFDHEVAFTQDEPHSAGQHICPVLVLVNG